MTNTRAAILHGRRLRIGLKGSEVSLYYTIIILIIIISYHEPSRKDGRFFLGGVEQILYYNLTKSYVLTDIKGLYKLEIFVNTVEPNPIDMQMCSTWYDDCQFSYHGIL